ncbi:hypothetical protein [Halocatena halophila]|uniref:hypothetical protein n=1 Tax=Halocatena halophila TaxID=2814576 RepID=UPI002ED30228
MNWREDLRTGSTIARAELRRSVRSISSDRRRLAEVAVVAVSVCLPLLVLVPVLIGEGWRVRASTALPPVAGWVTVATIGLLILAVYRTVSAVGAIDQDALVLTTAHPRAVVIGLTVAEWVRQLFTVGVIGCVLLTAFGVGAGVPWLGLTAFLVGTPLFWWTIVAGYVGGMGLLVLDDRLQFDRRLLAVGGVLVFLVVTIGSQLYVSRFTGAITALSPEAIAIQPLFAYAQLAFVGTPFADPIGSGPLIVGLFVIMSTPLALSISTRLATRHWLADDQRTTNRSHVTTGGFSPPIPFSWSPAGFVAWGALIRAIREPRNHGHVFTAFIAIAPFAGVYTNAPASEHGLLLALGGVLLATVLSGELFVLNPIGELTEQLPLVLLTRLSPRTLLRGRVIGATTAGVVVLTSVGLLALSIGLNLRSFVLVWLVGSVFCLAAALFSTGLGAAIPSSDTTQQWGTETVTPSIAAQIVFLFTVWDGATIGVVVLWLMLSGWLTVTPVVVGGLVCYSVVVVGPALASYRSAVRRFESITLAAVIE